MIKTLQLIKLEFGGVEEYVRNVCGLGDEDIARIRSRLLVTADGVDCVGWTWGHITRL
jgi:Tyrosine phosphatase family